MSLIRYTPHNLSHLQQQINRMFEQQADGDVFGRSEELGGGMFTPAVDVKEDQNAYTVHMEVPGVTEANLNITLQENVLAIRGTKEQKEEHSQGKYRRVERSYGTFARSLSLPRNVAADNVTANLEDGVLEIRLPKQEAARPRQISVGSTSQAEPSANQSASETPPKKSKKHAESPANSGETASV